MADREQLNLFGVWEKVAPAPIEEEPPAPVAPAPAVDPRQPDLFSGQWSVKAALTSACAALDAESARTALGVLQRAFPYHAWAEFGSDWIAGIEWLVGTASAPLGADERAVRALSLPDAQDSFREVAKLHFPSLPRHLLVEIRYAALCFAAEQLVIEQGPGARCPDGSAAGSLLLRARNPLSAVQSLRGALAAWEVDRAKTEESAVDRATRAETAARTPEGPGSPSSVPILVDAATVARTFALLGEAEWQTDAPKAAIAAYVRASLIDAAALDENEITCPPIGALLDLAVELELAEPLGMIPVLADLTGHMLLGAEAIPAPAGASQARKLAAELALYRRRRSAGQLDKAARIEAKGRVVALAPSGLKELLRRV